MPQPRLAAKRRKRTLLTPEPLQQLIAEATHQTILATFGDDLDSGAARRCMQYAFVGAAIRDGLQRHTGSDQYEWQPVVGTLTIITSRAADTPDGMGCAFEMKADDPATQGYEFHAWIQGYDLAAKSVVEVADLTSRHWRRLYENQTTWYRGEAPSDVCRWREPDPPDFLWFTPATLPDGLGYRGDLDLTRTVMAGIADELTQGGPLRDLLYLGWETAMALGKERMAAAAD